MEGRATDGESESRPRKRVSELAGILSRYARPGATEDGNAIRDETEKAVAEEVVRANARRVGRGRRAR